MSNNVYKLTRKELKQTGSCNFNEGDRIICNKYHIKIKYGDYSHPSMLSTVNTEEDLRDLPTIKRINKGR